MAASLPSKAPAAGPTVDLVFTGTYAFNAKGAAGRCVNTKDRFAVELTEKDYHGIGVDYSMAQFSGAPTADVKWLVTNTVTYGNAATGQIVVSADHASITIDADLAGSGGPEHVKGTIACPPR